MSKDIQFDNYDFYEKEKILLASGATERLAKVGKTLKGVLTSKEMQEKLITNKTIYCIEDDNVFFFTDDYNLGYKYIPSCFVSSSTVIPHKVKPREKFPDGMINNVEDYINLYMDFKKQVNTIDELVEYLNKQYIHS